MRKVGRRGNGGKEEKESVSGLLLSAGETFLSWNANKNRTPRALSPLERSLLVAKTRPSSGSDSHRHARHQREKKVTSRSRRRGRQGNGPSKLPPRYRDAPSKFSTRAASLSRARAGLSLSPSLLNSRAQRSRSSRVEEKRKRKSLIRLKKRHAPFVAARRGRVKSGRVRPRRG